MSFLNSSSLLMKQLLTSLAKSMAAYGEGENLKNSGNTKKTPQMLPQQVTKYEPLLVWRQSNRHRAILPILPSLHNES